MSIDSTSHYIGEDLVEDALEDIRTILGEHYREATFKLDSLVHRLALPHIPEDCSVCEAKR